MFYGTVGVDFAEGAGALAGKPDGFAIGVQPYAMRCGVYVFFSAFGMYFHVDLFNDMAIVIQPGYEAVKFQRYPKLPLSIYEQTMRAAAIRHFVMGEQLAFVIKFGHLVHILPGDEDKLSVHYQLMG